MRKGTVVFFNDRLERVAESLTHQEWLVLGFALHVEDREMLVRLRLERRKDVALSVIDEISLVVFDHNRHLRASDLPVKYFSKYPIAKLPFCLTNFIQRFLVRNKIQRAVWIHL